VMLVSEPTNQTASDVQANRLFAIEQFLLAYHPPYTVLYAPDPDPDGVSNEGK